MVPVTCIRQWGSSRYSIINTYCVLFVLKFYMSMLFISQFTKHNDCKITFFLSHCVFQDLSTRRRIGLGHERGHIYYLDDRVTPTGLIADQPNQVLLLHWRLGHLLVQKLQYVILIASSVSSLGCESCELGKHHRATYQSRVNNHSSSAFELVHSDVWGPSCIPFIKDYRNFLLFVDDFSP